MSIKLDREGIFRARPVYWGVNESPNSQSIALVIEFQILAQLDGDQWSDWSGFEEHTITGWFYVVKKDGGINTTTVESLKRAIGWDGSLPKQGTPPDVVCQIDCRFEEYNGKTNLKVKWLNHGEYVPGPQGADSTAVAAIEGRYGSLLRAAAASVKADPPAKFVAGTPDAGPDVGDGDNLPF